MPVPFPVPNPGVPFLIGTAIPVTVLAGGASITTGDATLAANICGVRKLKVARCALQTKDTSANFTAARDLITKLNAQGTRTQLTFFTTLDGQLYNNQIRTDLTNVTNESYTDTLAALTAMSDLVHDFEFGNESDYYPPIYNEVPLNLTNSVASNYVNKPACEMFAAIFKGMSNALVAHRIATGLPLRAIIQCNGRNWGWLQFMALRGVQWDITAYHAYPYEVHASWLNDTWYGPGGLFPQLGQFGKPVTINEYNAGEVVEPAYDNIVGSEWVEKGFRSNVKHLKECIQQTVCDIDSVLFYSLTDQPWHGGASAARWGLLYNYTTPKISLYIAAGFAGGQLSSAERTQLTSRSLLLSEADLLAYIEARPKIHTLTEDFTAGTLDAAKFWVWNPKPGENSATTSGGQLTVTLASSTVGDIVSVVSQNRFDLRASSILVKLAQPLRNATNVAGITSSILQLEQESGSGEDAGHKLKFELGTDGVLRALVTSAFMVSHVVTITSTYFADAATYTWLRIRENAGIYYWDTAPSSASTPPLESQWVNRTSRTLAQLPGNFASTLVKPCEVIHLGTGGAGTQTLKLDELNTASNTGIGAALAVTEAGSDRAVITNRLGFNSFTEDFNSGSLAAWSLFQDGVNNTAVATGGVLDLDINHAVDGSFLSLVGIARYNLIGNKVFARLVRPIRTTSDVIGVNTNFILQGEGDGNYMRWTVSSDGNLYAVVDNAFVSTQITVTSVYFSNQSTYAWLRMREADGVYYWDSAPSTASNPPIEGDWVNRWSRTLAQMPQAFSNALIHFQCYNGSAAAGLPTQSAQWDGVNTSAGGVLGTITGSLSVQEVGVDTTAVDADVKITASLAVTEANRDDFAATFGQPQPPITDLVFRSWLMNPGAIRCVLVEAVSRVGAVETTRYMSNMGFVTAASDTPPNTHYESCIIGGCETDEEISINGKAVLTVGDIEISNCGGERDSWLNDIWRNRVVRVYVGDMRWTRPDFRLVFNGLAYNLVPGTRNSLNIELRDKLQRLNTAVSDKQIKDGALTGGVFVNSEDLMPLVFGECHNIEPVLEDKATLRYFWHGGSKYESGINTERVIEVRDNGVVRTFTGGTAGTITLDTASVGHITASVQGDKVSPGGTYANNISSLVQQIVTRYGSDRFTAGDLDAANLASFQAAHPQPVGFACKGRENVFDVCSKLADSVGAVLTVSPAGLMRLTKIALPAPGTPTTITATNMIAKSFELIERVPVRGSIKLGYCRNWTVQDNLQTGIPADHKDLFAKEWLTINVSDDATVLNYKLSDEPVQEESHLLVETDAHAEAIRRLNLWKVPRGIYTYEGFAETLLEELGGSQLVVLNRYGFDAGKNAQIIGINKSWFTFKTRIKVLA